MGRHKEIMTEWFETVWNKNDPSFIHKTCCNTMVTRGHRGREIKGPKDFEQFYDIICSLVDDIHMEIINSVEEADWISVVYLFEAKRKDNGEKVSMTGSSMLRFKDEKVVEVYEHVDFLTFFEGLNVIPENVLETCLSGQSIL